MFEIRKHLQKKSTDFIIENRSFWFDFFFSLSSYIHLSKGEKENLLCVDADKILAEIT